MSTRDLMIETVILPRASGVEPVREGATPLDLRALFEQHVDFVWRSLRRLGVDAAGADDATQEVFLVASRRLAEIVAGKERAFLFGTAVRVASAARRARARRPVVADAEAVDRVADAAAGADELTERRDARDLLDRLLDEMDDDLRAVFVLFELEELTMAEIATLLELPPGTVASRLRRAREDWSARIARHRARARGGPR